jgi:poly-gamma-glutamate synthase PgsB/CapB
VLILMLIAGAVILATLAVVEQKRHLRRLYSIPIRIHVNGTRGKSTVTRLIAAGLREAGIRTLAKTTGSAARMILPGGEEIPIVRGPGVPSVGEQLAVVKGAADIQAQALVVECMAVDPKLQWVSEHKMLLATIGVVTNVREDHVPEMGASLEEIGRALCNTTPRGGVLVLGECEDLTPFEETAKAMNTRLIRPEADFVPSDMTGKFPYLMLVENLASALAACEAAGVPREVALAGMLKAAPDPGATVITDFAVNGCSVRFINLLAANEPHSTRVCLQSLEERHEIVGTPIALINCRIDRVARAYQFGELLGNGELKADRAYLIGWSTWPAKREAVKRGFPADRIIELAGAHIDPETVFKRMIESAQDGAVTVIAVGNIHGQGEALLDYVRERGASKHEGTEMVH